MSTPPEADALKEARGKLIEARRRLLGELADVDADLRVIAESREIELEERSQEEAARMVLARLDEREFAELREIQSALDRIAAGTYGKCNACSDPIAPGRLRALPAAPLCADCASASEARHAGRPQPASREHARGALAVPPDLAALDDGEVARLARETFRAKAGDVLDTVRVSCRYGVATLSGWVAAEELREIALRIVEDELGVEAVDRIGVSEIPRWRQRELTWLVTENEIVEAAAAGNESSDDVFEVEEGCLEVSLWERRR